MKRNDPRLRTIAGTLSAVLGLGTLIALLPGRGVELNDFEPTEQPVEQREDLDDHGRRSHQAEIARRFAEAVAMLHAKRFEYALLALDRVIALAPQMPEAHTNRGYALLGLQRPAEARGSFEKAIDARPEQVNAYYGLAIALDELGDREGALGAMRTFVHLAEPDDRFVRKARAALWEWQSAREESRARGAGIGALGSTREASDSEDSS